MNNSTALRTLAIYGICLPLAIFLGYLLAGPLTWTSLTTVVVVFAVLVTPIFLRFHHPILVLAWNAVMVAFFFPGSPKFWMPIAMISLVLSTARRTMDRQFRFISVPTVFWPVVTLVVVVLATAKLTGGIGLKSFGGDVYGGKRYVFLLGGVMSYFALTAQRIPRERAKLYVTMFILGGLTVLLGDIFIFDIAPVHYLALIFPPSSYVFGNAAGESVRFAGINGAALVLFSFMLAKCGIRGIYKSPWRLGIFMILGLASMLGGFRSALLSLVILFSVQFCLEGLHRTGLLFGLILGVVFMGAISLPFTRHMPYSIQRTLSVVPGLEVDPIARMDAESSTEWRLKMWQALLPKIPQYLLLGKGYALSLQDFDFSVSNSQGSVKAFSEDQSWAALAGDYHSGPLSLIIPFGLWGVIAFLWLLVAGCRVLYLNYRYGDAELKKANTYLLAAFIAKIIMFFLVYGALDVDMQIFLGLIGFGVSLNGGVAKPVFEADSTEAVLAGLPNRMAVARRVTA